MLNISKKMQKMVNISENIFLKGSTILRSRISRIPILRRNLEQKVFF